MAAERLPVEPNSGADVQVIEALVASGQHREALAACARMYAMPLGRLCMAFTGSQAESEELVQETLLAAFDAFPQYRGDGSVRAFLFGIARRTATPGGASSWMFSPLSCRPRVRRLTLRP